MGQPRNSKKLIMNSALPFKACSRYWIRGETHIYTANTFSLGAVRGFAIAPGWREENGIAGFSDAPELPVNFFSTELMEVDTESESSIVSFLSKWGFPYSIDRFTTGRFGIDRAAILQTDEAYKYAEEMNEYPFDVDILFFISKREATETIEELQSIVRTLFKGITDKDITTSELFDLQRLNYVNFGSTAIDIRCFDGFEGMCSILPKESGLTSAIATQITDTIADENGWYQCKAPDCGRYFKYKRADRAKGAARANSEYCSDRCSNRVHVRNYRKSKQKPEPAAKPAMEGNK